MTNTKAILVVLVALVAFGAVWAVRSVHATRQREAAAMAALQEFEEGMMSRHSAAVARAAINRRAAASRRQEAEFAATVRVTIDRSGDAVRGATALAESEYRPIYGKLKLSEGSAHAASQAIAQYWFESGFILFLANREDIPADDPGIAAMEREEEATLAARLQLLLEPSAYQAVRDFSRVATMRAQVVAFLGVDLSGTEAPLTDEQADQLTQIIAIHSPSYLSGGEVGHDISWDGVISDAENLLSPRQIEALQQRKERLQLTWSTPAR